MNIIKDCKKAAYIIFLSALGAVFFLSGCGGFNANNDPAHFHQHYEALMDPDALEAAWDALAQAEALHGKSRYPVSAIYLRRSQARRDYYRLTLAEINDRQAFATRLLAPGAGTDIAVLKSALSQTAIQAIKSWSTGKKTTPHADMAVVHEINAALQKGVIGAASSSSGFSLFSSGGPVRSGRKKLDLLFPGSILPAARRVQVSESFELCEVTDRQRGEYVLYLRRYPDEEGFHLELWHEVHHILSPDVFDWYMEGMCTLFAEQMAQRTGKSWTPWQRRFERRRRDPYSLSYYLIRELDREVGSEDLGRMLNFTVPFEGYPGKLRIDIDAWLAGLPPHLGEKARAVIRRHGPELDRRKGRGVAFTMPSRAAAAGRLDIY